MFRRLAWKLAKPLGIRWVLAQIDAAANGRLGPTWRSIYWSLAGAKTWTGVVAGVVALTLGALGSTHAAEVVAAMAGVAITAGLLDKAWRSPHVPVALERLSIYRVLAANSAGITTALVAALGWVQSSACHAVVIAGTTITCAVMSTVLLCLAAACAYLGLLDASFAARAPLPPSAAAAFRRFPPSGPLAAALLVALVPLSGCASAQARLGREPRPLGPDQDVVEGLVCRGEIAEAERYVELRGGSQADRTELVERARKTMKNRPGCCVATGNCGAGR